MRLAPKESDVQVAIKTALESAGFNVLHTSAFRQKGPSGVSRGVPDLLIRHRDVPYVFLGMEIKRPGKISWSSIEQRALYEAGAFHVAQTPAQALLQAHCWLSRQLGSTHPAALRSRRTLSSFGTEADASNRQGT